MDKKLFLALIFSSVTVIGLQYFLHRNDPVANQAPVTGMVTPGQAFKVPSKEDIVKPLNREIDFVDKKSVGSPVFTTIETDLYKMDFSTFGGNLSSVEYKKILGKQKTPLKTVYSKDFFQRTEGCFLLALNEKTPYFYELEEFNPDFLADKAKISYKATVGSWLFRKTYLISKTSYKIDLNLEVVPSSFNAALSGVVEPIQPRLIFPAPFVNELLGDVNNGFYYDSLTKALKRYTPARDGSIENAWVMPEIFGTEDKYFVHALVNDADHFTQRAYYKKSGLGDNLFSILEGPVVKEKTSWNLSFYFGPKDMKHLVAVDSKLEGLLDFGWLSWLCKLLLKFLSLIYGFVHNYGLAIIIVAFLIKLPLLPLTIKTQNMMERYQKYQPQISRIREKFKGDMARQQEEIVRFHKEHNISPATQLVGCLPLVIDMPIMIGLYKVLVNYTDLYQAPFFGWIIDLSSKDPFYILPILMGVSMIWQQQLTPTGDAKQKVIMWFMSIFVTVLFSNFAAGLVLYWLTKNLLAIAETYFRKAFFRAS